MQLSPNANDQEHVPTQYPNVDQVVQGIDIILEQAKYAELAHQRIKESCEKVTRNINEAIGRYADTANYVEFLEGDITKMAT